MKSSYVFLALLGVLLALASRVVMWMIVQARDLPVPWYALPGRGAHVELAR